MEEERWWPLRPNEPGEVPVLGGVELNDVASELGAVLCEPGIATGRASGAGAWKGCRRGEVMGGMVPGMRLGYSRISGSGVAGCCDGRGVGLLF